MESSELDSIRSHYKSIIFSLEPLHITDYLYQEYAISDEDLEDIKEIPKRRDRCQHMFLVLSKRAKEPRRQVFNKFLESLDHECYGFLASQIRETLHQKELEAQALSDRNKPQRKDDAEIKVAEEETPKLKNEPPDKTSNSENETTTHSHETTKDNESGPRNTDDNDNDQKTGLSLHNNNLNFGPLLYQVSNETEEKFLLHLELLRELDEAEVDTDNENYSRVYGVSTANSKLGFTNKKLSVLFDGLSSLINEGHFSKFYSYLDVLKTDEEHLSQITRTSQDATNNGVSQDAKCLLLYLEACSYLFSNQLDKCEEVIDSALRIAPHTSFPSCFLVQILSTKCWLCLKMKKLNVLEGTLRDAIQLIEQDPLSCAGKAAGWIYVDEARRLQPLMNGQDLSKAVVLKERAIGSLEKAIEQFEKEGSKDGPFGKYYCSTKLASLKVACDDKLETNLMKTTPTEADLKTAKTLLDSVEQSPGGMPVIIRLNFCLSKTDYYFRLKTYGKALEYANEAVSIANELNLPEELACAHNKREKVLFCAEKQLLVKTKRCSVSEYFASSENDSPSCSDTPRYRLFNRRKVLTKTKERIRRISEKHPCEHYKEHVCETTKKRLTFEIPDIVIQHRLFISVLLILFIVYLFVPLTIFV